MQNYFIIDLYDAYIAQGELDQLIHANHATDYQKTLEKRQLAFLVELGELANATRSFKFWSTKGPEPRARLLDEFADGLHFLLSLGLAEDLPPVLEVVLEVDNVLAKATLDELFLTTSGLFTRFVNSTANEKPINYQVLMKLFILIGVKLEFEAGEMLTAYFAKNAENRRRQATGY